MMLGWPYATGRRWCRRGDGQAAGGRDLLADVRTPCRSEMIRAGHSVPRLVASGLDASAWATRENRKRAGRPLQWSGSAPSSKGQRDQPGEAFSNQVGNVWRRLGG
jgi:hypothetical protein